MILTGDGKKAIAGSSVLDTKNPEGLLEMLTESERRQIIKGLDLLAKAAIR